MDNDKDFLINSRGKELMETLRKDLDGFFSEDACQGGCSNHIFSSEADIQHRLMEYLRHLGKYTRVMVEYKVPKKIYESRLTKLGFQLPSPVYPWDNQIRIDIVVEKEGKFAAIELKYPTAVLKGDELFGEVIEFDYLSKQDASNLIMYDYWKDVRRIEMASLVFKNLVGGFAILITNDDGYLNVPGPTAAYKEFSTYNERKVNKPNSIILLDWDESHRKIEIKKDHPKFILDGYYECDWKPTCLQSEEVRSRKFDYLMLEINKNTVNPYKKKNFVVDKNVTVKNLTEWFKEETGLVLKVYKGRNVLNDNELLIANGGIKGGIQFRDNITIKGLEKKFKEKLNLTVKIFTKDDCVHVLPGITLASAGQIPSGATKKSMIDYLGYKRENKK